MIELQGLNITKSTVFGHVITEESIDQLYIFPVEDCPCYHFYEILYATMHINASLGKTRRISKPLNVK